MPDVIQSKAAELGVPDWRDTAAYPKSDELWLSDWRWEFLRRSPRYREAYGWAVQDSTDQSKFEPEDAEIYVTIKTKRFVFQKGPSGRRALYFTRHFGLISPVDPRLSAKEYVEHQKHLDAGASYFNKFIDTETVHTRIAVNRLHIQDILDSATNSDIFIRISLDKPLNPQFQRAWDFASDAQRSRLRTIPRPRMDKNMWPLYLRVLDAKDCSNATYYDIANASGRAYDSRPNAIELARSWFESAVALRDAWPFAPEEDPPPLDWATLFGELPDQSEPPDQTRKRSGLDSNPTKTRFRPKRPQSFDNGPGPLRNRPLTKRADRSPS